jgi:hypothetical protein
MNQRDRLEANLSKVSGLRVVEGHRCTGKHAAPWEQGVMIWESLQDVFGLLREEKGAGWLRGERLAPQVRMT